MTTDGDALVEVRPELLLLEGVVPELASADSPRKPGDVHDVLILIEGLFLSLVKSQLPEVLPELTHFNTK